MGGFQCMNLAPPCLGGHRELFKFAVWGAVCRMALAAETSLSEMLADQCTCSFRVKFVTAFFRRAGSVQCWGPEHSSTLRLMGSLFAGNNLERWMSNQEEK